MPKLIAFYGSPGSGKTSIALKTAMETYIQTKDEIIAFLSPDMTVPSVALLFPNYAPDEVVSLSDIFDNTAITNESLLKNGVTVKNVFVDDKYLYSAVLAIFNKVIKNPYLLILEYVKDETYYPSIDIIRQENEIRHMMDQPSLQFQPIKKVILSCAGDKFSCCEDDFVNTTEALAEYFSAMDKLEAFDYDLLFDAVEKIFINSNGSITIKFINGKEINSEREEQ